MTNGMAPAPAADGLAFAEWLAQVVMRWKLIAWVTVGIVAAAVTISLVSGPVYRARATFLAVPNAGSHMAAGLANIAGASGLAQQLGFGMTGDPTTSPAFYQQLVSSRELLTRLATAPYPDPRRPGGRATATLVELIGPEKLPPAKTLELTLQRTSGMVRAAADTKTNLITVTADTRWPELSATLANRVTALVDSFNVEQRKSRARERRVFADSRVQDAQASLRAAEDRLRDFQQTNRQWQQSPELMFEQGRLSRQVSIESELFLTLRRELEMSRLDEVNDTPVITVVDSAIVPAIRQWPKRTMMVMASVVIGLMLGVLTAGTLALAADWAHRNPGQAVDLRTAFGGLTRAIPGVGRRRGSVPVTDDR